MLDLFQSVGWKTKRMQMFESNIVKSSLNLNNRVRSTSVLNALYVEKFNNKLKSESKRTLDLRKKQEIIRRPLL